MTQHSKIGELRNHPQDKPAGHELNADKPPRHPANCTLGLGSSSVLMHGGFDRCMAGLMGGFHVPATFWRERTLTPCCSNQK